MKKIAAVLSIIIFLVLGTIIFSALGNQNTLEPSLAEQHLDNFDLLMSLSLAGKNSLEAAEVEPDRYQQERMIGEITSSVDINHALILSYDGTEIPAQLTDNFDRIFGVTADYFNIDYTNARVVIWMLDFETLQEIPSGADSCFQRCPATIAALYSPIFDYFFFTPRYVNDYYLAHSLLHYLIHHYGKVVADGLPQSIAGQSPTQLPILEYLKMNEETIIIELSKIIIRKNLARESLGLGED